MLLTVKPNREVDFGMFTDLTGVACTSIMWTDEGGLALTFAADLTAAEQRAVRLRCRTVDSNEETLLRNVWTAYQANADYLALASPTQAQVVGQVSALTRQMQNVTKFLADL